MEKQRQQMSDERVEEKNNIDMHIAMHIPKVVCNSYSF